METSRKNLKSMSLLILFLAALSLTRNIIDAVSTGFKADNVPNGMTETAVMIATIVAFVVSLVLLIPQIYVGVKGVKVANNPETSSKGYIIWAKILFVFAIIATVFSVVDLVNAADKLNSVLALVNVILDVVVYFLFIKYANQVTKSAS